MCVEAILLFFTSSSAEVVKAAIPKVKTLLLDPLPEMAAWQLMLLVGLQQAASSDSSSSLTEEMLQPAVSEGEQFSMDRIEEISETLLAATSGFPKVQWVQNRTTCQGIYILLLPLILSTDT